MLTTKLLRVAQCARPSLVTSSSPAWRSSTPRWVSSTSNTSVEEAKEETPKEPVISDYTDAKPPAVLSNIDDHRVDFPPFARDLFIGVFNHVVLSYPDVMENDRYFALEQRCKDFRAGLEKNADLIQNVEMEGKIGGELLKSLKDMGAFNFAMRTADGGAGLCVTESLRCVEEFAVNPSLAATVVSANTIPYHVINRFGSDQTKASYLPGLGSGELRGAICYGDSTCGSDPGSGGTTAVYDSDAQVFVLNGVKAWVGHANEADVFIVFAKTAHNIGEGVTSEVTCFAVDANAKGVFVHPPSKCQAGLKAVDYCSVSFTNVELHPSTMIKELGRGFEVVGEVLSPDRVFAGAQVVASLRKLYDVVLKHTTQKSAFGRELCEFDLVKLKLSRMATKIFALESMTYMTAGLADVQKEEDYGMEANMTKVYAVQAVRSVLDDAMSILGAQSYNTDLPFHQLAQDLRSIELWEGTTDIVKLQIGIEAMMHVQGENAEKFMRRRNPFIFVRDFFSSMWQNRKVAQLEPAMTLGLWQFVHPSLKDQIDLVEKCTHILRFAVERVFVNHGVNSQMKELDLERLAEAGTLLYAMASSVARANRSYCKGHEHGELEVYISSAICNEYEKKIEELLKQSIAGFLNNNDMLMFKISRYMLVKGKYSPVHPVTKNIF